ncbi:unnamed protein product [Haemonchus placei]|uniref:CAP10 domain-containing protein n=1 Tax=Haemonchus placei TaxID=6290 RepID=A0A0N4WG68_HAEPC|nr:unnamed protein product [Haemonchus placei]
MDMGVTWWAVPYEIDHINVNRKFCLTGAAAVPKFYMGIRSPNTVVILDRFASLASLWEDPVSDNDNIDEEYDRLVEHLHDSTGKAERFAAALENIKHHMEWETAATYIISALQMTSCL